MCYLFKYIEKSEILFRKKKCHSFCKVCIDEFLRQRDNCPTCKEIFKYRINISLNNELNKLTFKCEFQKEGCDNIIPYSEYLNHINNCKYNDSIFICNIKKYNYNYKDFEKCGYIGRKIDIEKHFKICAYIKYKSLFCNKYILQMDLEKHVKSECLFGINKYPNGNKYIGEKQNKKREGYGIYYFSNGVRYGGDWKNGGREGYGIIYFSDGSRYEGEWKDDIIKGYGIWRNT